MILKAIIITAIILLILFLIALVVYVFRSKNEKSISKIQLYVSVVGIIVSVLVAIVSAISLDKESEDISDTVIPQHSESTTSITPESNINTDVIADNNQNNHEENFASSLNKDTSNDTTPAENVYSNEKSEAIETDKDNKAITTQKQYASTHLSDFKTYSYDGSYKKEDITSDPRGNTYNDAYVFYGEYFTLNTGGGKYDRPFFEKYIGSNYDEFTAVIIPHDTFDKYNKNVEAVIKIYANDSLIYTSDKISRKTERIEVNLPISGIKYLKIELNPVTDLTSYYNQYSVILYDAMLVAH